MKPKTITTVVLLAFVIASAAYFIFSETTRQKRLAEIANGSEVDPSTATTADAGDKVVVYYFHATKRCWTCKTIEAYSEEAIKDGFAEQLESGTMEWRTVNVDEPENAHFIDDFDMATRTVVLVHIVDGVTKEWKRLDRVWELVQDKPAFVEYVLDNANEFLADTHG